MKNLDQQILAARNVLEKSDAVMILAGAGMGVDSGLQDFRGRNGFWNTYPVLKQKQLSFYDMASPEMFDRNPELAWGFYGQRLNRYREAVPHQGFHILKNLVEKMPYGYFVFTSNVDGHFQKAGFDEKRVYECHGSIHFLQTMQQGEIVPANDWSVEVDSHTLMAKSLPKNTEGLLLRPNILMFNDYGWNPIRADAQKERYWKWLDSLPVERNLALIEIGAGDDIATVRMESRMLQDIKSATYIQINPNGDHISDIPIELGAREALSRIFPKKI